jgi:hypothetical protein
MPQGEIFKTTGRWHKKVRTKQLSIKKYRTQPPGMSVNICTIEQEEKSIDSTQAVEKITNAIRNPQLYRITEEINEHIFGTKKDNGVIITLI